MKKPEWGNVRIAKAMTGESVMDSVLNMEAMRDEFLSYIAYLERPRYAKDITYNYRFDTGAVSINCPCGEKEIWLFPDDGDGHECACGRVYLLKHYVEIVPKDVGK